MQITDFQRLGPGQKGFAGDSRARRQGDVARIAIDLDEADALWHVEGQIGMSGERALHSDDARLLLSAHEDEERDEEEHRIVEQAEGPEKERHALAQARSQAEHTFDSRLHPERSR